MISRAISDEFGRYFLIAPKGSYILQVIKSGSNEAKSYIVKLKKKGSVKKRVVV
jgi:hypothetical protein